MGMITAHRIAAALLGGSMSGAQLETLLGTASGLAGWKFCAATQGLRDLLLTDVTAKTAWTGSSKAIGIMATTIPLMTGESAAIIAADSTIMNGVFSTAAGADAWFASDVGRAAIWNSDTALTALAGSATGKSRARACAKYTLHTMPGSGAEQTFPEPMGTPGEKFILIGWGVNTGYISITLSGRREGSIVGVLVGSVGVSTTAAIDNVVALKGPVKANFNVGYMGYFGAVRV